MHRKRLTIRLMVDPPVRAFRVRARDTEHNSRRISRPNRPKLTRALSDALHIQSLPSIFFCMLEVIRLSFYRVASDLQATNISTAMNRLRHVHGN